MERWEWEKSALWCSTSLRNIPLYKRAILVGKTWQNHHKPWDLCVPHLQIELRFPPPPAARERFSATTNPPKTHQIHWFQPAFCVLGVLGMLKTLISTCILLRLSFFQYKILPFCNRNMLNQVDTATWFGRLIDEDSWDWLFSAQLFESC